MCLILTTKFPEAIIMGIFQARKLMFKTGWIIAQFTNLGAGRTSLQFLAVVLSPVCEYPFSYSYTLTWENKALCEEGSNPMAFPWFCVHPDNL